VAALNLSELFGGPVSLAVASDADFFAGSRRYFRVRPAFEGEAWPGAVVYVRRRGSRFDRIITASPLSACQLGDDQRLAEIMFNAFAEVERLEKMTPAKGGAGRGSGVLAATKPIASTGCDG